ncbi:acyltransferase family protein [Marinicella litoralis]|uniref:Exopolysaccharide production protein ExoZ n=1 Tax=Marinicella litoralis TaxID=644220 RepID=A0A4R6XZN3_9GAMM|nr:acyltransferase [Marinicella litoralis]TDR23253.1 exopolysaccharide production protein ExoZ [Marinicella litoralis]
MKPIVNIQFLRAVAALAVMFYHFSLQYQSINPGQAHGFFDLFNLIGYAGVDFFFVISGYIMWVTTKRASTQSPVLNFAFKRFSRIYLGYWPYFLLALLILYFYPQLKPANANMWGSFFLTEPDTTHLLIQVAWTLQYELYFYVLFGLLMLLPSKHKLNAVWAIVALIIVYQIASRFSSTHSHSDFTAVDFLLSPYCLEFFAGCLLGRFFQTQRCNHFWPLLLGLALLATAVYYQAHVLQQSLISQQHVILRVCFFGSAAALIMAALIELEKRGQVLLKHLSLILGGASYSIYLSHTIFIALTIALGWHSWVQNNSQSPGLWVGLFMLLTVVYSVVHYLLIEKPLMAMSNHIKQRLFH